MNVHNVHSRSESRFTEFDARGKLNALHISISAHTHNHNHNHWTKLTKQTTSWTSEQTSRVHIWICVGIWPNTLLYTQLALVQPRYCQIHKTLLLSQLKWIEHDCGKFVFKLTVHALSLSFVPYRFNLTGRYIKMGQYTRTLIHFIGRKNQFNPIARASLFPFRVHCYWLVRVNNVLIRIEAIIENCRLNRSCDILSLFNRYLKMFFGQT